MRSRALFTALAAVLAVVPAGCGGDRAPLPGAEDGASRTAIADGRVPSPAPPAAAAPQEDWAALPLKAEGIGSEAELDRALAKLEDGAARAQFEKGFRGCFVTDRARRDYASAVPAMEGVLERVPGFAPAYRVLAYAYFNMSFDMTRAVEYYEKAIAADPDYGEAHYALSFMLTQSDLERGRRHFERAIELGVPDERDLRGQFYK
jgi:tetratricopeptide (TPR) repeat protein